MSDGINNVEAIDPALLRPGGTVDHPLLRVAHLSKSYAMADNRRLTLFDQLHFSVQTGEVVAVVGPSGVGKSSLLHLLGALDRPTSGEVWFGCGAQRRVDQLAGSAASTFRNQEIGFVWQFHYLLPEFTAEENVSMPLLARGLPRKTVMEQARHWLGRVGLAQRATNRSGELSGGEQQRVSLARALITKPKLLLADEPTGNLDGDSSDAIFALLQQVHREENLTTVLVTHNMTLARRCHRVLRLSNTGIKEVAPASV
jgi:lipoprotein-releasing system ATP-binding protein